MKADIKIDTVKLLKEKKTDGAGGFHLNYLKRFMSSNDPELIARAERRMEMLDRRFNGRPGFAWLNRVKK